MFLTQAFESPITHDKAQLSLVILDLYHIAAHLAHLLM
jgi:hypothetical protein